MKLLISIIFKGQQSIKGPYFKFSSQIVPEPYQSVFASTGTFNEEEKLGIMEKFQEMIQKIHNFEISQIHEETYVQYLHLLSQITVNTQELIQRQGQQAEEGFAVHEQLGQLNFTNNSQFLIKNIHFFSEKCIQEDQRKKLLNSKESGQKNLVYQYFFINYLLSVATVDVVHQAWLKTNSKEESVSQGDQKQVSPSKKRTGKIEGERSISQKIFIILAKLLEALSDKELNQQIDDIIIGRIQTFKKTEESQLQDGEGSSVHHQSKISQPNVRKAEGEQASMVVNQNSATLTITKMILFNLDKLLKVIKQVQDRFWMEGNNKPDFLNKRSNQDVITHKLQIIHIDEDQLELLVRLLIQHEENGEMVNKIYEILTNLIEVSKSSSQAFSNINVIDMSKSLLHICIKHSSIYQCENAFIFLKSLVMVSDKYQNKQDIQISLNKIMPVNMRAKSIHNRDLEAHADYNQPESRLTSENLEDVQVIEDEN
uniref:Uncharacterized protein n=1 Tax=Strombidium rassoulzadegani TaxID=1082188 RepID=A0A7S3CLG3_9SPIT|mmetsp:Transcript_15935/g.26849  ORF Transcript_15935/g.26849 Transcript_15935/m.26849 type:complete len:484 (+) Transcript_15935:521-1972(+)